MNMYNEMCDSTVMRDMMTSRSHLNSSRLGNAYSFYSMMHNLHERVECSGSGGSVDERQCSESAFEMDGNMLNRDALDLCVIRKLAQEMQERGARRRNFDLRRQVDEDMMEDDEMLEAFETVCGRPDVLRPARMAPIYLRGKHSQ